MISATAHSRFQLRLCGPVQQHLDSGNCDLNEPEQPKRPSAVKLVLLALLAVYSPYLLGWFCLDCSSCRKQWATWLPILPGIAPEIMALQLPQSSYAQRPLRTLFGKSIAQSSRTCAEALRMRPAWEHHVFQGMVTIGLLAGVVTATYKCSFWRFILGVTFLFSIAFAALTYALFRA